MSSNRMSACRTNFPGLSKTPKHRSIYSAGSLFDCVCLTVIETCLSVLQRSRNDDRSLGADVNAFLVTFSLISRDTINSYSADVNGFPVMSAVMDVSICALLSAVELMLPVKLCGNRWNALEKQTVRKYEFIKMFRISL